MTATLICLAWVAVPAALLALIAWRAPDRSLTPEEANEQAAAIARSRRGRA